MRERNTERKNPITAITNSEYETMADLNRGILLEYIIQPSRYTHVAMSILCRINHTHEIIEKYISKIIATSAKRTRRIFLIENFIPINKKCYLFDFFFPKVSFFLFFSFSSISTISSPKYSSREPHLSAGLNILLRLLSSISIGVPSKPKISRIRFSIYRVYEK